MKKVFSLLAFLVGLSTANVWGAVDPNFYIYLCFGQSNMEGNAQPEAVDKSYVDPRFQMLATCDFSSPKRTMGEWYTAECPIVSPWGGLGMADYFGRTMVAALPSNVKVGVVDVAIGGIAIEGFMSDKIAGILAKADGWQAERIRAYSSDPYRRLVEMGKKAMESGVIKGILLHQGETDAYDDQWRKTLRKIYHDLQQELRFDSTAVPLLVGEVVRGEYGGICGHANPTINDIANHYPNTYVVSSEGCLPSDDNLHFSSEGYRQLGRHYALRYLEVTNPALAGVCRQKLAAAGLDKVSISTSSLTVETKRNGMTLSVSASEPVEKVDVVSFSGQTVKTYTLGGKKSFELSLKELPKEKLVFVFQTINGKATKDIDI